MIKKFGIFFTVLGAVLAFATQALALTIDSSQADAFRVTSGNYSWTISKTQFDVVSSMKKLSANQALLQGGQASVQFMGSTITFGAPSEFYSGPDWVELRGWASQPNNLWYVARYRFWDGKPYAHLALTLTDRHDTPRTYGPTSDPVWTTRLLSNLEVTVNATSSLESKRYIQYNSYSGASDSSAWIDFIAVEGAPYQWFRETGFAGLDLTYQLTHSSKGNGKNQAIWHPKFTGEADLSLNFVPYPASVIYKQALECAYEVKHAQGVQTIVVAKDKFLSSPIALGRFTLDQNSTITLKDTVSGGSIIANGLIVKPTDGRPSFEIKPVSQPFGRLPDNVLTLGSYAFIVQDIWQHHPIEVFSGGASMGVKAITQPAIWMGGMGFTLDLAIVADGDSNEAMTLIKAPPERKLPLWWDPIDGNLLAAPGFDDIVNQTKEVMRKSDEERDNYGWKNWGDYQIDWSYYIGGQAYENWASMQYDLPTSLLMAWVRTGDPELWQRARAAIRHIMDIDLVKFTPFDYKYSGQVHRKGECSVSLSHVCQEPVSAFSDAWRGLLLYWYLTGEEWAKDTAQMQIDNSAYILRRNLKWVSTWGSRDAAWIMRSLVYGTKVFPGGTKYLSNDSNVPMPVGTSYSASLETGINGLLTEMERLCRYPGQQPVWMGQGVETLGEYYRLPSAANKDRAKKVLLATADFLISPYASKQLADGSFIYVYDYSYTTGTTTINLDSVCSPGPDPSYDWSKVTWTSSPNEKDNYGWLWLSGLTAAYDLTGDAKYSDYAKRIYQYVLKRYTDPATKYMFENPRTWTSALGYPWLFIERFVSTGNAIPTQDAKPPAAPRGFKIKKQ